MTSFVELAAQLLGPCEREAVLGDLAEAGESAWRGLLGVLGLVIRREAIFWKSWRPWLAAFGLSMPASFCLMGYSLTVSWSFQSWMAGGRATPVLISALLLTAWSWTGGFVVASLSRRTLWMSILATCSPCLFCLARFRQSSLPRICLLVFLAPAIWGAWRCMRRNGIRLRSATVLAVAVTAASMLPLWGTTQFVMILPAWYIVATARKAKIA